MMRLLALACMLTLVSLSAASAAADDLPRARAGSFLAPAQILQCLINQDEIGAQTETLNQEKAQLDQSAAELQLEQNQLNERGDQLAAYILQQNQMANRAISATDSGNTGLDQYLKQYSGVQGARRNFNKANAGHLARLDAYNARADLYNQHLETLRKRSQTVDRYCAGTRVKPKDLADAKARLAAQKAAPAKP